MEEKKKVSKLKDIVAEIAHDLNINQTLVKKILVVAFKEIALLLLLKGKPVMIRRFIKFVIAKKKI